MTKKEEEIQKKYMQLQMHKQQLSSFLEEKAMLDSRLAETESTITALEKLESVAKGEEIWSTLGSGVFVMSDIKNTENVLISIGAGLVINEKKDRAAEILKSRLEEMKKINDEMVKEMTKIGEKAEALEQELEHLVQ